MQEEEEEEDDLKSFHVIVMLKLLLTMAAALILSKNCTLLCIERFWKAILMPKTLNIRFDIE